MRHSVQREELTQHRNFCCGSLRLSTLTIESGPTTITLVFDFTNTTEVAKRRIPTRSTVFSAFPVLITARHSGFDEDIIDAPAEYPLVPTSAITGNVANRSCAGQNPTLS